MNRHDTADTADTAAGRQMLTESRHRRMGPAPVDAGFAERRKANSEFCRRIDRAVGIFLRHCGEEGTLEALAQTVAVNLRAMFSATVSALWTVDAGERLEPTAWIGPAIPASRKDSLVASLIPFAWESGFGGPNSHLPATEYGCLLETGRLFDDLGSILALRIFRHGQPIGLCVLTRESTAGFTVTEKAELLEAAPAISGSMGVARMSPRARSVEKLNEREAALCRRNEVLTRANEASNQSLVELTAETDSRRFVGRVLGVLVNQFGAVGGEFWHLDQHDLTFTIPVAFEGGGILLGDESAISRVIAAERNLPERRQSDAAAHSRKGKIHVTDEEAIASLPVVASLRPHLAGIKTMIGIPLFSRETHIGTVGLRFAEARRFTADEEELAFSLAHQVVLATELSRLSKQESLVAIANDRIEGARLRAEKLERANRFLRESVQHMGAIEDVDAFLADSLVAAAGLAGPCAAGLRIREGEGPTILKLAVSDGNLEQDSSSSAERRTLAAEWWDDLIVSMGSVHSTGASPTSLRVDTLEALHPDSRKMLEAIGVTSMLILPLSFGAIVLGSFVFMLTSEHVVPEDDLQLIQAMVSRAAFAIHLKRLGDNARMTAVALERERSALLAAEELEFANRSVTRIIEMQVSGPDIEGVLAHALQVICATLGNANGTGSLWIRNPSSQREQVWLVLEDGRAVSLAQGSSHQGSHEDSELTLRAAAPFDLETGLDTYLADLTNDEAVVFAMDMAGTKVGTFVIRVGASGRPNAGKLRLAETIVKQATLALQSHQMTEQARRMAGLEERNRIAGDLHDSLAQAFIEIVTQLEAVEAEMERGSHSALNRLVRVKESARFGLGEARKAVLALGPAELQEVELGFALRKLVERANLVGETPCSFEVIGRERDLPRSHREALHRATQEGLANSIKYARARRISVVIEYGPSLVRLRIEDDGVGFGARAMDSDGFGLQNMKRRIELLGGSVSIASKAKLGTKLVIRLPVSLSLHNN